MALVNNGAILEPGPIQFKTDQQIDATINTNYIGPVKLTRKFLSTIIKNQGTPPFSLCGLDWLFSRKNCYDLFCWRRITFTIYWYLPHHQTRYLFFWNLASKRNSSLWYKHLSIRVTVLILLQVPLFQMSNLELFKLI